MLFRTPFYATDSLLANRDTDSLTRLVSLASVLAGLAGFALLADLQVHRFCDADWIPGELRRLLTWSELFAHGLGVALVACTMFALDPTHRRQIPRILAAAFGAGLVADLVKLAVSRFRPRHFSSDIVWDSFAGWVPMVWPTDGFSRFDHRLQSFPSAHTAVAAGLAIGLANVYPRGRWLFFIFAVLSAGQRIECGAHFLSDTLAGGAIGCLVAAAIYGSRAEGRESRARMGLGSRV